MPGGASGLPKTSWDVHDNVKRTTNEYSRFRMNNPSTGPQNKDFYMFLIFCLGPGRFSIGFVSKCRAKVAYVEVGSSDLDQI